MSLLVLEGVTRRVRSGAHERVVLDRVCLTVQAGETVAVWGMRRSGRSTLLRIAAGVESPDRGVVRFDGRALAGSGEALGHGIGYCGAGSREEEAHGVLDELLLAQLARGVPRQAASSRALSALERTRALECARHGWHELDAAEAIRVRVARALALEPSLLVVDEPTKGVDLLARDGVLELLRSLADEEGMAVLWSAGDAAALAGADRALTLSDGVLHGSAGPELAAVLPMPRRASA